MSKIVCVFVIVFMIMSCNSSDSWDCVKTAGDIQKEEIDVDFFDKLDIRDRIQLIVKSGLERKVILETGENLRDKISLTVNDSILRMENKNKCNLFRDYGETKIFVTTPQLEEIRNGSVFPVLSDGVLNYEKLDLISEDTNFDEEIHTVGDFELDIDVDKLNIIANGSAHFFIKGKADQTFIGFYSGISRFEGAELMMQDLRIFHRSSNDMIVKPQSAIRGKIVSVGNVIALNRPQVIDVEELWDGRLIFQD